MNKLVDNSADPEQVRRGLLKHKTARQQHLEKLATVLATRDGRDVLWTFIQAGRYFDTFPNAGSVEALNFDAGSRSLAGSMVKDIGEASPDALNAMLQKHFEAVQEKFLKGKSQADGLPSDESEG